MEKIAGYEVHPVASVLPLMEGEELDAFCHDVRVNGLRHPVVMHEGKVLDGRNRLLACQRTGIEPRFVQWDCLGGSPASFVVSENVSRRHLTPSQKAMLAAKLLPFFEAEAKERQRQAGGKKKAVSAPGREAVPPAGEKAAALAAKAGDSSERSVERAKFVAKASPELAEKVLAGKATLKQAEKQLRHADQVEKVKAYELPKGEYALIVADPPWRYEDELAGDNARGGTPYPTMSVDEIAAMKVPAAKDCILWLWVTNAHLLDGAAAEVLSGWGFTPKTMATWPKPKMGVGRWLRGQTEHVILAVRGKPTVDLTNETTLLPPWPVGEHSAKPADFYDWVERLCPAPKGGRLELFARKERYGWVTSGAEAAPAKCLGHEDLKKPCDGTPGKTGRCPSCVTRHAWIQKRKREDDGRKQAKALTTCLAKGCLEVIPSYGNRYCTKHQKPAASAEAKKRATPCAEPGCKVRTLSEKCDQHSALDALAKRAAERTAAKAAPKGTCQSCGCTWDTPCEDGCAWVDDTESLCTACVELEPGDKPVQKTKKKGRAT